jgi:hypothetical protein
MVVMASSDSVLGIAAIFQTSQVPKLKTQRVSRGVFSGGGISRKLFTWLARSGTSEGVGYWESI